jgi:hypothetical protein
MYVIKYKKYKKYKNIYKWLKQLKIEQKNIIEQE